MDKLKDNGILIVINYPENNNILFADLIRKGYNFVQELVWNYHPHAGVNKRKYTKSHRTIIIFSKSKEYTFHPIKQPYKNLNDKRIQKRIKGGSNGTNHYDVFTIQQCKNVSRDKKNIGINQLPEKLVEMLIKTYTEEGGFILDPFVGNHTVINIAEKLNRNSVGIDINNYFQI